jgi:hypothetical protein
LCASLLTQFDLHSHNFPYYLPALSPSNVNPGEP